MGCGASSQYRYAESATATIVTPLNFIDEEDVIDYEIGFNAKAMSRFRGGCPPPSPTTRDESDEFRVLRESNLSGQVTLYVAGGKHKKPVQYEASRACPRAAEQPKISDRCPFCPGQEDKTPVSVLRFDGDGMLLADDAEGGDWAVRVFPNIFPMLVCPPALYGNAHAQKLTSIPHSEVARGVHANHKVARDVDNPTFLQVDAMGCSEVVVESPRHNALLALGHPTSIELMLRALIARGKVLSAHSWAKQLLYFKQYGPLSGGSLVHPHTQIVSLPVLPPPLKSRLEYSLYARGEHGHCATCQALVDPFVKKFDGLSRSPTNRSYRSIRSRGPMLSVDTIPTTAEADDVDEGSRLVHITPYFVVSVPYASSSQYCMAVAPRRHSADFLDCTPEEIEDLAEILALLSQAIYVGLDDPSYNIFIRTRPCTDTVKVRGREVSSKEINDAFHWILEFRPRFPADVGGFEIASGVRVVTGLPEDHAEQLRTFVRDRLNAGVEPIMAKEPSKQSCHALPAQGASKIEAGPAPPAQKLTLMSTFRKASKQAAEPDPSHSISKLNFFDRQVSKQSVQSACSTSIFRSGSKQAWPKDELR